MKKMISGLALVLAFALTSLGFAQSGPPVPDGCTFELGVTTCTTVVEESVLNVGGFKGSLFLQECFRPGLDTVNIDNASSYDAVIETTVTTTVSTFYGVSTVPKDQSVDPITTSTHTTAYRCFAGPESRPFFTLP